jgi:hypothetical protein
MRIVAICLLIAILFVPTAYAGEYSNSCDGYKGKLLNRCHKVVHPERDDPAGIGVDVLVHETKHADIVAEYKRDFNNNEHSIFGVVRTKTSVVELAKKLVKKIKGEEAQ